MLRMLSDQKRRVENVNTLIEFHMKKFEYFRVAKLKVSLLSYYSNKYLLSIYFYFYKNNTKILLFSQDIFNEVARSQAFYYAKGLECFAPSCASITKVSLADLAEVIYSFLFHFACLSLCSLCLV